MLLLDRGVKTAPEDGEDDKEVVVVVVVVVVPAIVLLVPFIGKNREVAIG